MTFALMSLSIKMDISPIADDYSFPTEFEFTQANDVVQIADMHFDDLLFMNENVEFDQNNFGTSNISSNVSANNSPQSSLGKELLTYAFKPGRSGSAFFDTSSGVSLQQVAPTLEEADGLDHVPESNNVWTKDAFFMEEESEPEPEPETEQGEDECMRETLQNDESISSTKSSNSDSSDLSSPDIADVQEISLATSSLKRKLVEINSSRKRSRQAEDHESKRYTLRSSLNQQSVDLVNTSDHTVPSFKPLFSRALYTPTNNLPLSTRANQIVDDFMSGALPNETPDKFRYRILASIKTHIISHISTVGEKICQEAHLKPRLGDFLSRMKGCLRNAGLALYIVENLGNSTIALDEEMIRDILEHVPPLSTRPATKRVDGKKVTLERSLGLNAASRETVDGFWINHLKKDNRSFMRQHVSEWPGHWDKLGL